MQQDPARAGVHYSLKPAALRKCRGTVFPVIPCCAAAHPSQPAQQGQAHLTAVPQSIWNCSISTTDGLMLEILYLMPPANADTPVHECWGGEVYPRWCLTHRCGALQRSRGMFLSTVCCFLWKSWAILFSYIREESCLPAWSRQGCDIKLFFLEEHLLFPKV